MPLSRLAVLLALSAAAPELAAAQAYPPAEPGRSSGPKRGRTELTAIAGYQVNTDVDTSGGSLRVDDAPVFGAAISFESLPGAFAELLWLYSDPSVKASGISALAGTGSFNVPTHYFQVGGTKGVQRDRLTIFGGGTIGAALFLPESIRFNNGGSISLDDTWRFAFTLGAGLKVDLGPRLALRFDARLAAPVYWSGGSFYVGSGGSGMSVSGGIPLWQWNFLGGLTFRP